MLLPEFCYLTMGGFAANQGLERLGTHIQRMILQWNPSQDGFHADLESGILHPESTILQDGLPPGVPLGFPRWPPGSPCQLRMVGLAKIDAHLAAQAR